MSNESRDSVSILRGEHADSVEVIGYTPSSSWSFATNFCHQLRNEAYFTIFFLLIFVLQCVFLTSRAGLEQ
jgi:hypothetical protein